MPPAVERAPAPEEPFWRDKEKLPSASELKTRGVKLEVLCGRPGKEVVFAEPRYEAATKTGYAWSGWGLPIYYARSGNEEAAIELTVPKGATGLVRVYVIDPDNFEGGRKQQVFVAGDDMGTLDKFQGGKWLEHAVSTGQTADGKVVVRAVNARKGSNAVISVIEWVEK
jgi:hypothetical protein